MNRRDLFKVGLAAGGLISSRRGSAASSGLDLGVDSGGVDRRTARYGQPGETPQESDRLEAEFIVVGSGAGGGTVAARLAEAGHTVLMGATTYRVMSGFAASFMSTCMSLICRMVNPSKRGGRSFDLTSFCLTIMRSALRRARQ